MQRTEFRSSDRRAGGFSLVEVLISIIVLSFGMLGMVGMQAAALQSNREARLQSVAYGLAQELAEMMRGNKAVGLLPSPGNPYLLDASSPLAPATESFCLNASGSGCTGTTLPDQTTIAQAQMTEWLARVDAELSGARVVVCPDAAPYDSTSGLPRWACAAASGSTPAQVFIKIGWTQSTTNRDVSTAAKAASSLVRTGNADSRPALVLPIIAGDA